MGGDARLKKWNKLLLNNGILTTVLVLVFVLIIGGVGSYAAYKEGFLDLSSIKDTFMSFNKLGGDSDGGEIIDETEAEGLISSPEPEMEIQPVESSPVIYSFPDRMMAVTINVGSDIYADKGESETDLRNEINEMIDYAAGISANTVFINSSCKDTVLYSSAAMPQTRVSFDIIKYISDKAREKGLGVFAIFNVLETSENGTLLRNQYVDADTLDFVKINSAALAEYDLDGIMLDDYSVSACSESYTKYLESGSSSGYEDYLRSSTSSAVNAAYDTIKSANPAVPVGISVDSVWANAGNIEGGSESEADNESFFDGFTDTKSLVESEQFDFVSVKCSYATTNKSAKFTDYVSWWEGVVPNDVPFYIFQYSSKACTDEKGWDDPSELSDQVIAAEKLGTFGGSIFDSVKALKDNPKQSTDALIQYLTENIDPSFLLTQLEMTKPSKLTFSTYESVSVFKGASDVNFDLMMNGEKVKRDANGAFMLTIDLTPGLNTFKFEHKEKTITYNITRNVKVLKEISPLGNVTINGGMSMTVSAIAYENSVVTATLAGSTVTLKESTEEDDSTDNESTYKTYTGQITVPAATLSEQSIGNIKVTGTWNGSFTESMEGAYVTVAAKATSGALVEVVTSNAETFPTNTLNDLSDYDCYPLAKGTRDYTEGDEIVYIEGSKTYTYYNLSSGQRVYTKDVKVVTGELGGNKISNLAVSANSRYTYVSLAMTQHVPYIAKYSSSAFTIEFVYTDSVPAGLNLTCTPLFSKASWSGTKLTLSLSTQGGFLGYTAYYDGDNLVFRFNNPTGSSSLSGVPIVVDVGHSKLGVGALGFLSAYGEYEINLEVGRRLKNELESRGATVYMMDTVSSRPSLEERVSYASSKNPLVFVSVHCNSSKSSTGNGTEAYYFTRFSSSLATLFSERVSSALGSKNRGSMLGRYYVTRTQEYPSILGEMGFVSNESDYYKMIQSSYQNEIASAIADSIQSYLGSVGRNGSYGFGSQSTDGSSVPVSSAPEETSSVPEMSSETPESSESTEDPESSSSEDTSTDTSEEDPGTDTATETDA